MPLLTESSIVLFTESGEPITLEGETPMSTAATSFRLFYPDTNTINSVSLFDAAGAAVTPQTVTDGAGDPPGYKSKVITFAAASQPLFATPTFANPAAPVSLYLTRDDAGVFTKVLDETVFNPATPARPTPALTAAQENLLYTATETTPGVFTYAVKAPVTPVSIIKPYTKDPVSGAPRQGNDILIRWLGVVPGMAEIEVDVEDILDPLGFVPVSTSNITTYAESSVGLSLVKSNVQILPQDGLSHTMKFRVRYNVNGDVGNWTETAQAIATYEMAPPNMPATFSVTLLRDRADVVPDVVQANWTKDAVSPGTSIEIFATDYLDKKHSLYESNGSETSARIENVSRFVVQETGPALAQPYRFSIVAKNISDKSDDKFAAAPLNITSRVKPVDPPTPDDIAGTARDVEYATLKAEVFSDVLTAMGTLPAEGQAICNAAIDRAVLKIKDVVSKGGSVTLLDFGLIGAKWTKERLARNPATGAPIVVPPYRSLGFTPSIGFKKGTREGTVMTDLQAKPPTP
jgi:nucleoid DNA-binding protein